MSHTDFSHMEFLNRVRALIQKEQMLSRGDSVLVGLSGGADSVALFRVLLELREEYGITVSCAHVNHGLRGETAHRDRKFSEDLCRKFDVPIAVLEEDVATYARQHQLSVEDAGRKIRYAFFKTQNTQKIAVAHTKDDSAETVLMNLLKGNLPLGIAPCREVIIRPLLCVTKKEIYNYLNYLGQDFVTDETNFTTDYTRNQIRLELIPYLEEKFNTNFTNTVYHSSDVLYREQQFLEKKTAELYQNAIREEKPFVVLSSEALKKADEVLTKRVIRRAYYQICPYGESISYEHLEDVYRLCQSGQKGKKISLPGGIVGLLSGDFLVVKPAEQKVLSKAVPKPETSVFCECFDCNICLSKKEKPNARFCYPIRIRKGDSVTIRQRCDGDKLYFHNVKIHKKLSDFFIDKKIPLHERDRIPLICVNGCVRVVMGHFYEDVSECPPEEQYYIIFT